MAQVARPTDPTDRVGHAPLFHEVVERLAIELRVPGFDVANLREHLRGLFVPRFQGLADHVGVDDAVDLLFALERLFQIALSVADALQQAGERPIMIATGCTFDPGTVPPENLHAIRRAVETGT